MTNKKHKQQEHSLEYHARFRPGFLLPRFWLSWVGIFVLWLLTWSPVGVKNILAKMIAVVSVRPAGKRYIIARKNLTACFPVKTESEIDAMVKKSFYLKTRIFLDYGFLWFASEKRLKKLYSVSNDGELRGLKTLDKNVVLLTCHMWGLDFGAQALSFDHHITGLIKEVRNPLMNWLVARGRTRFNTRLFERDYGMMGIVASVKAGDLFFYLPDEDLEGAKTEFISFFGVQKATLTALGRLAKVCDAKVLPVASVFNEKTSKYEVHFLPSLKDYPTGDKREDALRMNQAMERLILLAPEQYMWTFRYFKSRPPGEPEIY